MSKIFSFVISTLPRLTKLGKKERGSSKKPQTRTLVAEPLEERLPVSSSAAGVLLGLGLAQDQESPPAYESSQTASLPDLTPKLLASDALDIQLDGFAVDQVHAEQSLLDIGSSASDDPFALTSLSLDSSLNDAENDAHRELGDELLLFQISTLDFEQVQFEPMMPERTGMEKSAEIMSHDFDDALNPPDDLTAYGYSPIANELQEDDGGGTRCGCGSPDPVPYISSLKISGCGCALTCTKCSPSSSPQFNFSDKTFYTMVTEITVSMMGAGTGSISSISVKDDPNGLLIKGTGTITTGIKYTWNVPYEERSGAQNTFTFEFKVWNGSGSDTVEAYVHFGWSKVQVQFAGQDGFKPRSAVGGQTDNNTVVVGQKIEAIIANDPAFQMGLPSTFCWSEPTGGDVVKNYTTTDAVGIVTQLDKYNQDGNYAAHYKQATFDYYYYNKSAATGSLSCSGFSLTDPHGFINNNLGGSASFYIETPTVTSYLSAWAFDWPNYPSGENPVGVRPYKTGSDELILGGTPEGKDFSPGITWTAKVTTPPVVSGGQIAYNNQICRNDSRWFDEEDEYISKAVGLGFMLDTSFPYNNKIVSVDTILVGSDTPGTPLTLPGIKYLRNDSFKTYLIYKPIGTSIWVTLSVINWGWSGTVLYDDTSDKWQFSSGSPIGGGSGTSTTSLPEWADNIDNYHNWIKVE